MALEEPLLGDKARCENGRGRGSKIFLLLLPGKSKFSALSISCCPSLPPAARIHNLCLLEANRLSLRSHSLMCPCRCLSCCCALVLGPDVLPQALQNAPVKRTGTALWHQHAYHIPTRLQNCRNWQGGGQAYRQGRVSEPFCANSSQVRDL